MRIQFTFIVLITRYLIHFLLELSITLCICINSVDVLTKFRVGAFKRVFFVCILLLLLLLLSLVSSNYHSTDSSIIREWPVCTLDDMMVQLLSFHPHLIKSPPPSGWLSTVFVIIVIITLHVDTFSSVQRGKNMLSKKNILSHLYGTFTLSSSLLLFVIFSSQTCITYNFWVSCQLSLSRFTCPFFFSHVL